MDNLIDRGRSFLYSTGAIWKLSSAFLKGPFRPLRSSRELSELIQELPEARCSVSRTVPRIVTRPSGELEEFLQVQCHIRHL